MALDLNYELSRIVADARSHGLRSIDLAALERLLGRHNESLRRGRTPDVHGVDLMAVYPLE